MKNNKTLKLLIPIIVIALIVVGYFFILNINKPKSPKETIKFTSEELNIDIFYSRPSKRKRKIFGKLVPFNKIWRTGANEATEIAFNKDVIFGGKPLKAGRYTLFTIPHKKVWTIILNKKLNQWGAFKYKAKDDVLRTKIPLILEKNTQEALKLNIIEKDRKLYFRISWDKTRVDTPIVIKK